MLYDRITVGETYAVVRKRTANALDCYRGAVVSKDKPNGAGRGMDGRCIVRDDNDVPHDVSASKIYATWEQYQEQLRLKEQEQELLALARAEVDKRRALLEQLVRDVGLNLTEDVVMVNGLPRATVSFTVLDFLLVAYASNKRAVASA